MAKTQLRRRQKAGKGSKARPLARRRGVFEELEPRLVLAPVVDITSFPEVSFNQLANRFTFGGDWSARIEAAPNEFFGGDLFVVERNGTEVGRISRVDAGGTVRTFAELPTTGGSLGFGEFDDFFDLVFASTGNFGGPLFVSTTDQTIAENNAIYEFGIPAAALGLGGDTVGLHRASTSTFFLKNMNTPGAADQFFNFGVGGLMPLVGDWDGDGADTIGLFDPATNTFQLSNSNNSGAADLVFRFGPMASGWTPVAGDWNGDGTDTIGLFDPAASRWFLNNTNSGGIADQVFRFGPMAVGWTPVVGDWNNDGNDTPGLYDGASGTAFLTDTNAAGPANQVFRFGPAGAGWVPLAGDWNGDGTDTLGLYDQASATEYLTNVHAPGPATTVFRFGPAGVGWTPLAGAWNGTAATGLASPTTFAQFTLDSNNDFTFDDHPTTLAFGQGSVFGTDLYTADAELEGEGPGPFPFPPENGGNDLYRVNSTGSAFLVDTINTVLADVDPRAIAFNLSPTFDVSGFADTGRTLYMVSSDLEDTQLSTILQITGVPGSLTVNTLFSDDTANFQFGDMAFDPRGFFGGNLFVTDHVTNSVYSVDTAGTMTLFASGFNIGGLDTAFSITFSDDGLFMYVSDQDGIWQFESDFSFVTSDAGRITGVFDVFELGRPYTGRGFGATVIDTGVDASHPGFDGHVTLGFDAIIGNANPFGGTLDTDGHGTAVAGLISQIAPDTTIVPIQLLVGALATDERLFESLEIVANNPTAIDPVTGELVKIIVANYSLGSAPTYDAEAEAATNDGTTLYPFKEQMQRALAQGITSIVSAGNEGMLNFTQTTATPSGPGLDGMSMLAAINEAVSIIATYPYGPTPPLAPPVGTGLEGGDFFGFPDKVAAFSSRSQDSDFAAPGTALRTFLSTLVGPGLINPAFNGTSGAAPIVSGITVMANSALDFWTDVAVSGRTDANFLSPTGATLALGPITNLAPYLTPNGINSILQWTAEPIEDVDLGAEDFVSQLQSLIDPPNFRNYSRIDAANAVAAIEGKIAFDYFRQHPSQLVQIDTSGNGIITVGELQLFIDAMPGNGVSTIDQAFARLLGGTSSGSAVRRTQFFDRIDGTTHGGIRINEVGHLANIILPNPNAFPIDAVMDAQNTEVALQGYLLAPDTLRNWADLTLHEPGTDFVGDEIPSQWRGLSPAEIGATTAFLEYEATLPWPGRWADINYVHQPPGEQPIAIPIGELTSPPPGWTPTNASAPSGILAATASVDSTAFSDQVDDESLAFAPGTGGAGMETSGDSRSDIDFGMSTAAANGGMNGGGEADGSLDLALLELSDELSLGGLVDPLA